MDEGERDLQLLRVRVLDAVNTLRNRMTAANNQLAELTQAPLNANQRAAVAGLEAELRRTLALGDELLAAAGHETRGAPPPPRPAGRAGAARAAHIVVVEDDPSNRAILVRILQRLGHSVTPVADGIEAFDVLTLGGVDCVISDFQMPHLGGGSLYQQVESRMPEYAGRFIFITGDYTRDETRAFLERTGQPVLGKPYELDDLATALDTILSAHPR